MDQSAKALTGYEVRSDGRLIGLVGDLIVSPVGWSLRYLEVNLAPEVGESRLLPICAVASPDNEHGSLPVALTRDEILDGPSVARDRPLTRAEELAIHKHYCWAPYWSDADAECEPELVMLSDILGCRVDTLDGTAGRLTDLIVEDSFWTARCLVAAPDETRTGRAVTIRPDLVTALDTAGKRVAVRIHRSELSANQNRSGNDNRAEGSVNLTEGPI